MDVFLLGVFSMCNFKVNGRFLGDAYKEDIKRCSFMEKTKTGRLQEAHAATLYSQYEHLYV